MVSHLPIILRGFLLLAAIIIVGVGTVQHQLTNLTQKNDAANFFSFSFSLPVSLSWDNNYYDLDYLLRSGGEFFPAYRLFEINETDGGLIFKVSGHEFKPSLKINEINFKEGLYQIKADLNPLYEQFKKVAFKIKNYIKEFSLYLPVLN